MRSEMLAALFVDIGKRGINIDSLMIVRNGYIVVEANKRHFKNLYPVYSTTKSFTSAIVGIALAKGQIKDVDQKIAEFFPAISKKEADSKINSITLRHLLTMSCGFEWPELEMDYSNYDNPVFQMMMSEDWVEFLFSKPVTQQPGSEFNYNSGCSHLLLAVLDRSGVDVADFAQQHLFAPLGVSKDQYRWQEDPKGLLNGSHGLNIRPRAMAKFGYLYLKGGHWDGVQIIPKSWVQDSTRNHMKMNWEIFPADYYGFKWYIQPFGFHTAGYKGQYIFVMPEIELVIVITSSLLRLDIEIPIDLVKNFILPATGPSIPLPHNEKALTELNAEIVKFSGD